MTKTSQDFNYHDSTEAQHCPTEFAADEGWWRSVQATSPTATKSSIDLPEKLVEFDAEITLDVSSAEIVKGLFGPGDMVAAYGPSGVGKTFAILYMAYAIALGAALWFGRRVRSVPVLYVGLEGERGLRRRMIAARDAYGPAGHRLARVTVTAPLDKTERGKLGVEIIVSAAGYLSERAGEPVGVIIIDTLARAIAGDDENSAQDMSAFIEQRIAEIKRRTGATVIVVHHTGKDAARGMRGSYALYGAAEAVIRIDENRHIEVEKSRDGEVGPLGDYQLRQVILGHDSDGDPITTCVVDPLDESVVGEKRPKQLKPQSRRALEMLNRLFCEGKARVVPVRDINLEGLAPDRVPRVVTLNQWRDKCKEARLVPDGKPSSERMAFKRAVEDLTATNLIMHYNEYVWLLDQKKVFGRASPASQSSQ